VEEKRLKTAAAGLLPTDTLSRVSRAEAPVDRQFNQALHGGVVGGLSKVAGASSGKGGIPFAIEGTTSNPKFIPDVGGVVGGLATEQLSNVAKGQVPGAKNVSKGLGGLLGKKNK
jgi:hypothetical protein